MRIVYRSSGGENHKRRPPYYSKKLCLASFLNSLIASGADHELIFLNDGEIPADRLALMQSHGEVVSITSQPEMLLHEQIRTGRGGAGVSGSYLAALALVEDRAWPDGDLVYFSEDDYLYRPEAMGMLAEAAERIPAASYFSLYATVDMARCRTFVTADQSWHSALTCTSTFGARISALRADRWIHRVAWFATDNVDQSICLAYQGSRPFRFAEITGDVARELLRQPGSSRDGVRRGVLQTTLNLLALPASFRPHVLVTPHVPLATHCELPFLADGTDWAQLAETVASGPMLSGISELDIGPPLGAVLASPHESS